MVSEPPGLSIYLEAAGRIVRRLLLDPTLPVDRRDSVRLDRVDLGRTLSGCPRRTYRPRSRIKARLISRKAAQGHFHPLFRVCAFAGKFAYPARGVPQRLQKRAEMSFCAAPQDGQPRPTFRLAPHDEQKSDPATFAAPQVPHRPGNGGT